MTKADVHFSAIYDKHTFGLELKHWNKRKQSKAWYRHGSTMV